MRRPKIIATLGTTTDSRKVLEQMVAEGMSCARMNTAYATIDEYQQRLDLLREVASIDVMMDIKGPQVRLSADQPYQIDPGDIVYVGFADEPLHFNKDFYSDVNAGDEVLLENGTIRTRITTKQDRRLSLRIDEAGEGMIRRQMGVNVPGRYLNVPKLSQKDCEVIDFSVRNSVEYIALSFVRDYSDIYNLQDTIRHYKAGHDSQHDVRIIAKIEDRNGIENLPDILKQSRKSGIPLSVMVARGDLYVELPKGVLPYAQEEMISLCSRNRIFVITATGILESLQYQREPTRAEVCDVYNALLQGSDALMLSGETSNSVDPVNAVRKLAGLIDDHMTNYGGYNWKRQ